LEFHLIVSKDQMLGKYQIVDRLGAGGFGTVYLALDRLLNRKVALKVPHQPGDKEATLHMMQALLSPTPPREVKGSVLQEPRIMVTLKHPNIVELITVEIHEDTFFMVMEYVEGESLDKLIRQERSLKPQRALEIAIGICRAVEVAHSKNVLHRDLRPANIMMALDGTPKVTDFGTSRILEMQNGDEARTRIGSPPYMAPEHFKGRTVFQSDIWSLGITIYEMLTGTVPFYDADPVKIAQAISERPIVPPHLRNPKVPKAFSGTVMKALAVEKGERYISAHEMLKALTGLKEASAADSPPALPQIPAVPVAEMTPKANRICWNCFNPLPRLASACPRCGEKN
jgi:serine/threonine-protein kinase